MLPRLLPLLLVAACASKGGEGARGQGESAEPEPVVVPPAPPGGAWRTARGAAWKEILEDLAEADVVFVAGSREVELAALDYLYRRGRLHAIAIDTLPRTARKDLDDLSFGRIDAARLAERVAVADADRAVLAFAAERRLPVLGLAVEAEIRDAVLRPGPDGPPLGLDALTEEQRRSLPALPPQARFDGPGNDPGIALARRLDLAVAADVLVRWYRDEAPAGAQVAVLAARERVAPRSGLPEQLFARSGKTYRTLVAVAGKAEDADGSLFARGYADYVWFMPAK